MAKAVHHTAAPTKVAKKADKPKVEHLDKAESVGKCGSVEKSVKATKGDTAGKAITRVKAGKKSGATLKRVVHHAHNVDLAGSGHREPKLERAGALLTASLKSPGVHTKARVKRTSLKAGEMPRLPNPNAGKPSKGGAEKGARKPAEKKAASGDDISGEPTRDEEFAELVARIRGISPASEGRLARKDDDAEDRAEAAKPTKPVSHVTRKGPCTREPVEIVRGPEVDRFQLTQCDGKVAPLAVEHLSILIRPGSAARPTAPLAELAKKPGPEIARGIRRADPRLVARLQAVVDRFGAPGAPAKLFVISGYRPASVGSTHGTGRAIDFRVEGVKNEDVVAFCKTLADTGCGFYPNSSFVHIDVRESGSGQVTWIDVSGPGEAPRYVSSWPMPSEPSRHIHRASAKQSLESLAEEGEQILRALRPAEVEAAPENVDEHPALPAP